MTEQTDEQNPGKNSGFILIALGVIGLCSRLIGNPAWNTVGIIKVVASGVILVIGLMMVLKKGVDKKE